MFELLHYDNLPVMSVVTSLMPIDDVNVDDIIISLTGDDVTSLAYIVKEMYKF